MRAISKIFEKIKVNSALQKINKIHSPPNNAGVSFLMLLVCEPIHQNLDYEILPVCATIEGSKNWSINLFQMDPGEFWCKQTGIQS